MNKKVKEFEEGFINYQYKLIDEIVKQQERLDINDRKELAIYILLEGNIMNLMFRLKGIINIIKELNNEEITIPEKYNKYYKSAREMVYFKGDDLILTIIGGDKEEEMIAKELIDKIKSLKNGEQGKKDK